MAILRAPYKGLVVDSLQKCRRHEGVTTGVDKLPIYSEIIGLGEENQREHLNQKELEHQEQEQESDSSVGTGAGSGTEKGNKGKKKSKQEKKLERQQKKIRVSQRRLAKKTGNFNENSAVASQDMNDSPLMTAHNIKQIYKKYEGAKGEGEKKLIQYGTVALYNSDLRQMLPGEWINDNIISIVYEFLIKTYIDEQMSRHLRFINPPVVQLMLYTDYDIIDGADYRDAKFIMLPINETVEGDHWFLVVVNLLENSLHIYDSMADDSTQLIKTIVEKLTKYKLIASSAKIKIINVPIEQQSNFDDCGVYLIMITCYIISMIIDNDIDLDLSKMKFKPLKARLDILRLIDYLIATSQRSQ